MSSSRLGQSKFVNGTIWQLIFLLSVALVLVLLSPTASPQKGKKDESRNMKPEDVQGCYDLTLSEWKPNLHLGEDAEFITPPRRIELFAKRGTKGFEKGEYLVRPGPGVTPSIHRASYWRPKGNHSIEIVWTTGFSGLVIGLTQEKNGFKGQAKSFWDFGRPTQTADVVALRVECQNHKE
jgi:hypothetical protein